MTIFFVKYVKMTDCCAVKKEVTFWRHCLPNRIALASLATIASFGEVKDLEFCMAVYLGAWGGSLLYKFAYGLQEPCLNERLKGDLSDVDRNNVRRKLYKMQYGNFGGRVWWKRQRLVHAINLILYSSGTFLGYPNAYIFTIIDIAFAFWFGFSHFVLRGNCAQVVPEH
jgi:hypothetical protein